MRVFRLVTFLFPIIGLTYCSPKLHLPGVYQSDLFSKNFIVITIKIDNNLRATYSKIGDVFNERDSGFCEVNKDTLRIFYSPGPYTAAEKDSLVKYKIFPFPLAKGEFESKSSDNYFLIRRNKLLYLNTLGNRWTRYGNKKHRVYFLQKVS